MSKYTNNQILLNELIQQEFNENNQYNSIDNFFEFFSSAQLMKEFDLSDEEVDNGLTGAGADGGCDAIYLFINGVLIKDDNLPTTDDFKKDIKLELFIIQSKNSQSFKEDAIMKWKTLSGNLLRMSNKISDFSNRYNEDVLKSFENFKHCYIKLVRKISSLNIYFIYISKGVEVHPNVQAQADELQKEVKDLFPNPYINISVKFIGADALMELACNPKSRKYYLKLKENPISFSDKTDYILLSKLWDYFSFITNEKGELIKSIFESNVRDYQRGAGVNNEIQDTLKNPGLEDFWWLNNGITILASEATPVTVREISILDPEIVNGLQTSSEIFNYFTSHPEKKEEDQRSVLIRVIVPDNDEVRDKIILATNNQTPIPKASLRSTDSIHRQIEFYFKTRDLYYDRRKNYLI